MTGTLDQISSGITEMANNAEKMATEVEKGMENMDQMDALADLQNGLSSLASKYQSFHSGLVDYTDGVGELAASYQDIDAGIQGLSDGATSLNSGASELKDGTQELQEETSDLPGQMQSEVDEMMDEYDASDFEPKSFVSDKNETSRSCNSSCRPSQLKWKNLNQQRKLANRKKKAFGTDSWTSSAKGRTGQGTLRQRYIARRKSGFLFQGRANAGVGKNYNWKKKGFHYILGESLSFSKIPKSQSKHRTFKTLVLFCLCLALFSGTIVDSGYVEIIAE